MPTKDPHQNSPSKDKARLRTYEISVNQFDMRLEEDKEPEKSQKVAKKDEPVKLVKSCANMQTPTALRQAIS